MSHRVFKALLLDKSNNQEFVVKWKEDKKYLLLKNDFFSSRLYLDSIVNIQRQNEQLNLIAYPLINDKRERKLYSTHSNELLDLETALKNACVFKTPRKI